VKCKTFLLQTPKKVLRKFRRFTFYFYSFPYTMPFLRSISGLRATLGDALTPDVIAEYAAAFAAYLPDGSIVVGRDGRPSGLWIERVVCGTLAACGRNVQTLGLVTTPTVQLFAEQDGIAGGISISASHNPVEWNGMKFFNGRGLYLSAEENQAFWRIVDEKKFFFTPKQHGGAIALHHNPVAHHIEAVLKLPLFTPDAINSIRARGFRVVVDAVNCSGSFIVPQLLEHLSCEVVRLYCDGSGDFPHTPEPLPQHLSSLCAAVREHHADLGVAVDPDADRLVLINERGEAVWEEYTITLATLAVLSNKALFAGHPASNIHAPVVTNLSTTQAMADVAAQFGVETLRTAVGEINVVNAMLAHGSLVGGEGSGGIIVPRCHAGRDALVGVALVLLLMAQSEHSNLSAIVASLPQYAMSKHKKDFTGNPDAIFATVRKQFPEAQMNTDDGLHLSFTNDNANGRASNGGASWLHLRTSNTEPIIRLIAEAPTETEANELAMACLRYI
jgi:phosphomannomutase